eukprot:11598815-Ditylum_brightwellii.AAC.1
MVYSADGMPADEAEAAEKKMASLLVKAWQREYLEMCGFVRARMVLALAQSNTFLLQGEQDHREGLESALSWRTDQGWSFSNLGGREKECGGRRATPKDSRGRRT